LVMNLLSQPGETEGLSAAGHLQALRHHAGHRFCDAVVVNSQPITVTPAAERAVPYQLDELRALGVIAVEADVLADSAEPQHDPRKLAHVLRRLAAATPSRRKAA